MILKSKIKNIQHLLPVHQLPNSGTFVLVIEPDAVDAPYNINNIYSTSEYK